MLRYILSIVCLVALTSTCSGQQYVHVFLEKGQDKENADFMKCVKADVETIRTLLRHNIREPDLVFASGAGGFSYRPEKPSSASDLLKRIENYHVDEKDILFFYVSAHGESNDDGEYINLRVPVQTDDDRLSREKLMDALKQKKARLTILVTDCCNSYKAGSKSAKRADAIYPKPPRMPRGTAIELANTTVYRFKKLFFESKGFVDISSCSKGQKSYTDSMEIGSIFTLAFSKALEDDRERRRNVTWEEIGAHVRKRTEERFDFNFKTQDNYPRWKNAKGETIVQDKQTPVFIITRP